jgi:hypothetical protein
MDGHLYYGRNFERKTTPKWCPKNAKMVEEIGIQEKDK